MSIFDVTNNRKNEVRVNKFDWSHANNFTTEIGRITPVFCELFPQKGSFRTEPVLGLQFMPMVFPIQTRMKARVSFFRYPLRALWKDYRDYVGNFRPNLVEPYHDFNGRAPKTGSLYDYLGLPTTYPSFGYQDYIDFGSFNYYYSGPETDVDTICEHLPNYTEFSPFSAVLSDTPVSSTKFFVCFSKTFSDVENVSFITVGNVASSLPGSNVVFGFLDSNGVVISCKVYNEYSSPTTYSDIPVPLGANRCFYLQSFNPAQGVVTSLNSEYYLKLDDNRSLDGLKYSFVYDSSIVDIDSSTSPYYDSTSPNKEKQIKISAFAARAYEGIYNAYFRDDRNNPYYVDGEIQYNKWIPTDEGGADITPYQLHYANWEKDFLTTAVQSPQQGIAPLVGITTYEDTTLNADGTMTTQQRLALVDEDGRKFGLEFDSDAEGLNDVRYTELSQGQVVQQPRSLINLVQSGISINDIRNVNAYQKYLELNMRSGYSYKDIIQNRFNVKVRYSDLLMPEFIGGFTEDIEMHSITQNVETNDSGTYAGALGSQAGLAGCRRTGRPISCFCDEESIIIGVCVVTPVPVYTQLLPKHFTYRELLDHYQPEFNNIGFQPITYKEVCPIQAYKEKPETLNDTFGYQRPWYEFVQKYDVAHGLYRTQLRNFLMNRTFNVKPELSESFLLVNPAQINDVFSVTETTDKIYGQIYFKCTVKLPISRVSIPRLD